MLRAPTKRARGHLGRGVLLSLHLHALVPVPLGVAAFIYGGRQEPQRAEGVDVGCDAVPGEQLARTRNLEKNSKGKHEPASAPSQRQDEQIGGQKEQIRQLAEEKSAAGKMAPSVTPHAKPELASEDQRREESLLALRDP